MPEKYNPFSTNPSEDKKEEPNSARLQKLLKDYDKKVSLAKLRPEEAKKQRQAIIDEIIRLGREGTAEDYEFLKNLYTPQTEEKKEGPYYYREEEEPVFAGWTIRRYSYPQLPKRLNREMSFSVDITFANASGEEVPRKEAGFEAYMFKRINPWHNAFQYALGTLEYRGQNPDEKRMEL